MLEHLNATPVKPSRVVIIGAGGFVGSAISRNLAASDVITLGLTRKQVDLMSADAGAKLKALLKPDDSVVMISALAPAKNVALLMQNLRMAEAVCEALAAVTVHHLLYISSDAVYADDANPVTEESYCAPSTPHGMMHAARELMLKAVTLAPTAMLRPTLIYGANDPHNGYGPNRFRRQAQRGEPIPLFGEGEEQHGGGYVRSIRVADGGDVIRLEFVFRTSRRDKLRELLRAAHHVFFIEDTFRETPEETRCAVLQNFTARTQERCVGIEFAG